MLCGKEPRLRLDRFPIPADLYMLEVRKKSVYIIAARLLFELEDSSWRLHTLYHNTHPSKIEN